ncbi:LytTR family DNA-binding domain-containing protein [Lacinutrix sp. 5H-3-7-4]|uniref:LytR/AlgR family response regulator transcription factor n=1 Tax=Lacinutrix sp. (strain 5H-3-7-4) TaxID=983544 RepID=UPI00020A3C17|nr:response regulator [Lacinutrix sp. 5H-3-7-4]AEH01985.1 response regulator receiver protein [Lacinutrix sp. 5H-3-7-4]
MIRYILVDDNQNVLNNVKNDIDKLPKAYDLHHVKSYSNSKTAFQEINEDDFDLLIVDFEMPVYNGIELAQKIAGNKKIIFLTSTSNNEKLVINTLDISGYLSKPFELEEFEDVLKHKVIGKINVSSNLANKDLITLHIGANRDVRFKPEQVYYISTSSFNNVDPVGKNCVNIYGRNDELLYKNVRKTIQNLSKELKNFEFEKISKNTIVNLEHIKERDNTNISLFDTKETFEITSKEKSGFIARLRANFKF